MDVVIHVCHPSNGANLKYEDCGPGQSGQDPVSKVTRARMTKGSSCRDTALYCPEFKLWYYQKKKMLTKKPRICLRWCITHAALIKSTKCDTGLYWPVSFFHIRQKTCSMATILTDYVKVSFLRVTYAALCNWFPPLNISYCRFFLL